MATWPRLHFCLVKRGRRTPQWPTSLKDEIHTLPGSAMHQLELTRKERLRLEKQLKSAPSVRVFRRTFALLELDQGSSVGDVARMLHMSGKAVYNWVKVYGSTRNPSDLIDRPRSGRPTFWSEEQQAILQEALSQSPDDWNY